jgi:Xaa-Pro dipeptidase
MQNSKRARRNPPLMADYAPSALIRPTGYVREGLTAMEHEVLGKLRAAMKQLGHDALVAFSQDNVTYTAGFLVPSHASNRFRRTITIIAGDSFAAQIVVTVEENLVRQRSRFRDIRVYNQFTQDPADVLADALEEAGVADGRIAIELDYMPAQDYIRLRERLPKAAFTPCKDIYFTVRMVKTDTEIAILRKVGELTDRVAGEVLREIKPGMTEKAVGQIATNRMMDGGCDGLKVQVGSGARSGITNCTPTDKAIEKGDVVRLEILGDMNSYRSNVTRTAVVGEPTDEQKRIWEVMIGAREACKAVLKPGLAVADLYRIYVNYLTARNIEPTLKFLGHGIGQTIHEEPYITDSRTIVMQPNITFTMEPLYMIPGRMGFHVEDMYLITPSGYQPITGMLSPNDELIRIG